ncbi:RNA-binding S4 domain-containing protein [Thermococci archaeon]|nr:MAG: RNA-binding S4 domain-containing protein [Thermococci archaeon]
MRLDKYLKKIGVIKRRAVAQQMIKGGRVKVNGASVRPSYEIKESDEIEVFFGNRYLRIKVVRGGYEILDDEYVKRE